MPLIFFRNIFISLCKFLRELISNPGFNFLFFLFNPVPCVTFESQLTERSFIPTRYHGKLYAKNIDWFKNLRVKRQFRLSCSYLAMVLFNLLSLYIYISWYLVQENCTFLFSNLYIDEAHFDGNIGTLNFCITKGQFCVRVAA